MTTTTTTESTLTKRQRRKFGPKVYRDGSDTLRIIANVRYDDECGNGHNTFSITADIQRKGNNKQWYEDSGGCCHDEVAKHFPELAPLIKWHLCGSDGPLHYVANTVYFAGNKDHNGLRKGEEKQIRNGKTDLLCWEAVKSEDLKRIVDSNTKPEDTATIEYVPWCRVGEGKERELDHARSSAIWPDATDEELTAPGLKERLEARLPALIAEFQEAVESLGFVW